MSRHAEFIDSLRRLAARLEDHPEIDLPFTGLAEPLLFTAFGDDPVGAVSCWTSAFDAVRGPDSLDDTYARFDGHVGNIAVRIITRRDFIDDDTEPAAADVIAEEKRTAIAAEDRDDALACDLAERAAS